MMDKETKVASLFKQQLIGVYNKLKVERLDIDQTKYKYLDKIAKGCAITLTSADIDEITVRRLAKLSASEMLEISKKGNLTESELDGYIFQINQKAQKLADSTTTHERPDEGNEKNKSFAVQGNTGEGEESVPFIKKKIIPVGFEENAPKISVEEFFSFPLSAKHHPSKKEPYEQHLRYLEESVEQSGLDEGNFKQITQVIDSLPKLHYKKYFDVYPDGIFEEAILSILYIKLKNKSLERLRI